MKSSILECARTKWPGIPDDVKIVSSTRKRIVFPFLRRQTEAERATEDAIRTTQTFMWLRRELTAEMELQHADWLKEHGATASFEIVLEPVGDMWLGYNEQHGALVYLADKDGAPVLIGREA